MCNTRSLISGEFYAAIKGKMGGMYHLHTLQQKFQVHQNAIPPKLLWPLPCEVL